MASLIPGFEYDIFISYRQKDNKYDGWVTQFFENLKKELEATFKDEITIYFDINPHDSLLETYNVNASLREKVKCLVFIPIISQTYCDPRSFAWQNEFLAFNRMAQEDSYGRDIRLSNGNTASRILPVKIHDIDPEDRALLENELGGVLRSIDFIFKSPGVNRPLKPEDNRSDNLTHTYYRDQINKVANAVKEIVYSMKSPGNINRRISAENNDSAKNIARVKILRPALWALLVVLLSVSGFFVAPLISGNSSAEPEKSIAILPFEVLSKDPNDLYLGGGFADAIGTAMDEIKGLRVIGRTSSSLFKDEKTNFKDIRQKLQVGTLLGGSIQVSENNLRINVSLINAKDGSDIWTQTFNSNINNLFSIQDEITHEVVKRFKMGDKYSNHSAEDQLPKSKEAYYLVLKGNFFLDQGPVSGQKALECFQEAIKIDSTYADAYLGLSLSYFFTGEKTFEETKIKMKQALDKAKQLNANETKYHNTLAAYYFVYEWNWDGVRKEHEELLRINSPGCIAYAWYLAAIYSNFNGAINEMQLFLKSDPLHNDGLRNLSTLLILNKQYEDARRNLENILATNPDYSAAYERIGYSYFCEGKFEEAINNYKKADNYFKKVNNLSGQFSTRLEIVIALADSGKIDEAKKLFHQILDESKSLDRKDFAIGTGVGVGYSASMAMVCFSFGEPDEAFRWLNEAYERREPLLIALKIEPIFDPYRTDPRFISIYNKMNFPAESALTAK